MTTVDTASSEQTCKDHFSGHSRSYAEFRPTYPESLFSFLADCCARRQLAWDCATGNGQAARALTEYFEQVIGTDASEAQIQSAKSKPGIEFHVARAEESALDDNSIDLITVAQALHWFDIASFFDEAQRVLAPGGVLAVWSYERCFVDPDCDLLLKELYADILRSYWPPERKLVEEGYQGIELPMSSIAPPEFAMQIDWMAAEMLGYLRTWSASRRYLMDKGSDPLSLIEGRLLDAWGAGSRQVSWPLNLKIGRA